MRRLAPLALAALLALALEARADGPAAAPPAPPPLSPLGARVLEASDGEGTLEDRARRVRALGPEALAALLSEPGLARAADELAAEVVQGAAERELEAIAARLERAPRSLVRPLARRLTAPPRPQLLRLLARIDEAPLTDARGADEAGRAQALLGEVALRDGAAPFERLLFGEDALRGPARGRAIAALGASGRADVVAPLLTLLAAGDADAAVLAAQALARCPDPDGAGVDALRRALAHEDRRVRGAAATALGALRASEAVDALVEELSDDGAVPPLTEEEVAATAAGAGGSAGAPTAAGGSSGAALTAARRQAIEAAQARREAARAVGASARAAAMAALREIAGDPAFPRDPAAVPAWIAARRDATDRQLPLVLTEIDTGDPATLIRAVRALPRHQLRRDRIRPSLLALLATDDAKLRTIAAGTLGTLRDALGTAPLLDALEKDASPAVRAAACGALRAITGKDLPEDARAWRRRFLPAAPLVAQGAAAPATASPRRIGAPVR